MLYFLIGYCVIVSIVLLCVSIVNYYVMKESHKTINDLRVSLTEEEMKHRMFEAAYNELTKHINEVSKPKCDDCFYFYNNPIGGKASCSFYMIESPTETCSHFKHK